MEQEVGPIKLLDGSIKNSTLKIAGKPFRCSCGCNVFHQPDATRPEIYECNACETWYEGA